MEKANKISELIDAANDSLAELDARKRDHTARCATFRELLERSGECFNPSEIERIHALIDADEKLERETQIKIENAISRKSALIEVAEICSSQPVLNQKSKLAARMPDYDHGHKDLRVGSDIYKVREVLRKVGSPMLLSDLVKEVFDTEEIDKQQGKYASLRGTLTGYAKENRFFTIESTSPHIIGLIEFSAPESR